MATAPKAPPSKKRTKLGVDIEPVLKRRLDHEATDAELSLKDLIRLRLELSYRVNPGPLVENMPA
jgi:hypothetical protein